MGTGCIKLQRIGWKGATTASFLCCKNFEPNCFITEGVGTAMLLESLQRNGSKQMPYPQYFQNPLIVTVNQLRHPKDLLSKGVNILLRQQTDSLCIDIALQQPILHLCPSVIFNYSRRITFINKLTSLYFLHDQRTELLFQVKR